ncbi:MAG: Asp23/Gls24 family envelope stress response protein [Syntrophomonadaceae bacterium]|nr:Asp23/Gls24 family envelope stress response protein [Syntrophomonadaceae bacterium]
MDDIKPEIPNDLGVIRIADEVVSTVAGLATVEVEGVASMSGGWGTDLVEKLGKKNLGKGIKVDASGEQTIIDIFIIIEYGYAIPKVAENVQKEVKLAVESMTGLTVSAVNVHVVSVLTKKATSPDIEGISEIPVE